jgi:hypothetical protein
LVTFDDARECRHVKGDRWAGQLMESLVRRRDKNARTSCDRL